MKKKILTLVAIVATTVGLMSFTRSEDKSQNVVTVPTALESRLLETAVAQHLISSHDAKILADEEAMQQCLDAFVKSGFEPSAAVDKLADIAVESGTFKTNEAAKKAMLKTIENARKNEANWTAFYNILGL